KLVPFFPRDAKVAYAAAWCAYRRDQYADFFHYLRECLRREPDFCLGILLFARVLAEKERLNEAYFVFKFLKERLAADKSTDEISTLNQLIDAFVEKNGWISFVDQTDDQMVAAQFVSSLRGEQAPGEAAKEPASANLSPPETFPSQVSITIPSTGASSSTAAAPLVQDQSALAPAEIELGLGSDEMEIQHHSEKAAVKVPQQAVEEIQPAPPAETTGGTMIVRPGQFATDVSESVSLSLASADEPPPFSKEQAVPEASQGVTQAHTLSVAPEPMPAAPVKSGFDPLAGAIVDNNPLIENTDNEKTQIFSPMDLIGAASQAMSGYDDVKTKFISVAPPPPPPLPATYTPDPPEFTPAPANIGQPENAAEAKTHANPTSATMPSRTVGIQAPADEWHALKLDGAQTDLFSPMDVLQAQTDSRPNSTLEGGNVQTKMVQEIKQPRPVLAEPSAPVEVAPSPETGGSHGQGFMPIPPPMDQLDDLGLTIDMGDDLLDGATRILLAPSTSSATQNLLKEIQQDISKAEEAAPDPSMMLRKAERFIAKRNYYLARKALRHAQALGADEELVKKRLGEIRRLELPNSLYQAISSDEGNRERSSDILERLEQEFEISEDESANKEIENSIEAKLETIFKENDPRTILDFGVGLHEMGLYKQAEIVFARIVEDHPDFSFDAYYLAAVSKFSRKDYAGAVSILKKLSIDGDKTEQEKIQIYYALGELFEKMSQSDRSKEFFRKVAELDANYRNIRHKLEE
ncbi:MAG: hypothetical protein ACXVBE_03075, partial [Bdellovibrionota bacterium]